MNKKQRTKNRATSLELMYKLPPKYTCPNCKVKTHVGHFMPPGFGDLGAYTCTTLFDENGRRM